VGGSSGLGHSNADADEDEVEHSNRSHPPAAFASIVAGPGSASDGGSGWRGAVHRMMLLSQDDESPFALLYSQLALHGGAKEGPDLQVLAQLAVGLAGGGSLGEQLADAATLAGSSIAPTQLFNDTPGDVSKSESGLSDASGREPEV